jgi:predicted CxxxxCH...CXXCH cytochrome family protein
VLRSQALQDVHGRGLVSLQEREVHNPLSFDVDIKPIVDRSCAGLSCHSRGTTLGVAYEFAASETQFRSVGLAVLEDQRMPPRTSGKALSPGERQVLIQYLQGK